MAADTKLFEQMTFDQVIQAAQAGDGYAVEYLLLRAKYRDYTFNYHLRKVATQFFKQGTAELFDGLINELYLLIVKNDFRAIKGFNRSGEQDPMALKRMFFSWLMLTATRLFNSQRKRYLSDQHSDISHCAIAVEPEQSVVGTISDEVMLREAISKLRREEQRIVLLECLKDGEARRSCNVAKVLTAWRFRNGDMRVVTEADVNCIKSRAYVELRPILMAMDPDRVMRKRVVAKPPRK
ncbi:MAG: hypothetical protein IJX65_04200 [Alistipes sp.]|nr:hypothetical protein [Alistipes sp.]